MTKYADKEKKASYSSALDSYEEKIRNDLDRDSADIEDLKSDWQERDSPAERALRDVEWNQFSTLGKELSEIANARGRIEDGTYGLCEICNAQIPAVRLKLLPTARNCIECQTKTEQGKGVAAKPKTL